MRGAQYGEHSCTSSISDRTRLPQIFPLRGSGTREPLNLSDFRSDWFMSPLLGERLPFRQCSKLVPCVTDLIRRGESDEVREALAKLLRRNLWSCCSSAHALERFRGRHSRTSATCTESNCQSYLAPVSEQFEFRRRTAERRSECAQHPTCFAVRCWCGLERNRASDHSGRI
jgi:hypothetical protein